MVLLSKSVLSLLLISLQFSLLFTKVTGYCVCYITIPCPEHQDIIKENSASYDLTNEPIFESLGAALKTQRSCGAGYYQDRRGNCRKNVQLS